MRTDEWITEVRELARFTASCAVGVTSVNREVTVTVGAGGVPREITFGESAARLDGVSLARLVLETLRAAAARVDERLADRLGDHAGLLRGDLSTPAAQDEQGERAQNHSGARVAEVPGREGGVGAGDGVHGHAGSRPSGGAGTEPGGGAGPGPRREAVHAHAGHPIPELERFRELVADRAARSTRLRTSLGEDRTLAENSDGRIRILVRGVTVEQVSMADGLLAEYGAEALGMLLVSLIHGAIARSAARAAELTAELTGTRLDIPVPTGNRVETPGLTGTRADDSGRDGPQLNASGRTQLAGARLDGPGRGRG
ncbi:hypothetical protein Lfu02_48060 [Longispora fulva]|uniref:DNA-binding protein YbaB n=1 Tax=Longispora fulva TaxID=619741 RepID=A0A8J7KXQ4_9ACTN|nr:YbaB/EbfC family nucleoid-associated protein [Longispora fulva]MBG6138182.1 DNA-binding protein YbaB [Longispora fulva]GIG60434.1 hypothetical protein Lfu02_48060 [Longispora fulva]